MLTITDIAGARMTDLLDGESEDSVWRLVAWHRQLRLRKGHIRHDDHTFAHNGRVVLAINEQMFESLSARKIDVLQTDHGPRLKLRAMQS